MFVACLGQNDAVENEVKESTEELPQVETTPGQDGIHPITVFPSQMVAFHPVVQFEMAKDRLDRCTSGIPSPETGLHAPSLFTGQMDRRIGDLFACPPIPPVAIGVDGLPTGDPLDLFE